MKVSYPTSFSDLIVCPSKYFWHISLQGSVDKSPKCVCISSVVVTLKFVELFCFDKTVTYQNLLLTKNICRTFFSSFSLFLCLKKNSTVDL